MRHQIAYHKHGTMGRGARSARPSVAAAIVVALLVTSLPSLEAAKSWTNQLSTKEGGEVFLKGRYIEVRAHCQPSGHPRALASS